MPIDEQVLDATVRTYVDTMSSIRGRRVHRLLMREFSRFDHVLPVTLKTVLPRCSRLARMAASAYAEPTVEAQRRSGMSPSSPIVPPWLCG
jgi:hypothetical protein